ncbi:MAG TPA: RNA 2',3'-cyclic phosphodiesterase [Candidatus Eisenbacteria bacterium]|nr:RNA 2',3'-cyclic phosphodiesterase [Candidatus Eisenbacteria bacterium]
MAKQGENERLRIFLAVFPPPATQAAAERRIERLKQPDDHVSWVKRDNLHYTLRFLGDLGADGARRAAEAARAAAEAQPAFDACLGGLGAFPNARKARVLWLGLSKGGESLSALARAVEAALQKKGFGRADRPFASHLTIGRVRTPGRDWTDALEAAAAPQDEDGARFRVDRVLVVHSQLSPKGSIYSVRAEVPLRGES